MMACNYSICLHFGGSNSFSVPSFEVAVLFFFQAEDVIRYLPVTGVQTCALPISSRATAAGRSERCHADAPAPAAGGRAAVSPARTPGRRAAGRRAAGPPGAAFSGSL